MPWKKELPMEQRERFVILAQSDRYTKKELCEHFVPFGSGIEMYHLRLGLPLFPLLQNAVRKR
jgi:hypothetical protein